MTSDMRLVELLAAIDDDTLERLAHQHLGAGEMDSRTSRCINLENVLRSPKHVRDTVFTLRPPVFRILERLLDAEGHAVPVAGLREMVAADTADLATRVTSGQLVGRDKGLRLYRRVVAEARRNDLELDPSETALLGVLRHELGIRQVEHFLIEHHEDIQPYWNTDHAFLDALSGLRSSGLTHVVDGNLVFPDDLVAIARQVLGLEVSLDARRRLYERLSGGDTAAALAKADMRSTGTTKEEKATRLLENYLQPSEVLDAVSVADLRDLCRSLSINVGGAKEDLVARVVEHFRDGADIRPRTEPPPPPPPEPRTLEREAFDALFGSLRGQDLSDILSGIGSSRIVGTKEHLVRLVRESRFSEASLLMELDGKQLEAALARNRLPKHGTKPDRVQRLLACFAAGENMPPPVSLAEPSRESPPDA